VKTLVRGGLLTFLLLSSMLWAGISERFEKGDGFVKDRDTGFLWQLKDAKIKNERFTHDTAKKACEVLILAGKNGWRLPEFEELKALADAKNSDTAGFLQIFPDTNPRYYRTNTSAGDFTNASVVVGFKIGSVAEVPKDEPIFTRCVRQDK
jgi:Protein of unknown function (DUF1566)